MRETINLDVAEIAVGSQDTKSSRGFEEGVACLSVGDRLNCSGQTSVVESVSVSPTPDASTHSSTSSPPVTLPTIAKISCSNDIQEPSASEMFDYGHQSANNYQQLNLLQQVPLVSLSPFRENASVSRTSETVSPPSLE
jgi:hypothetical protein